MPPYECPYTAGAEFYLVVHPLPARNKPTSTACIKVLETYTFTKSQTMKVAITSNDSTLPTVALLKLFDRRYLEERMNHSKALRPWSYDKELLRALVEDEITKRRKEAPNPVNHSFTVEDMKPDEVIFADDDLDDEELEAVKDLDNQAVDQYRVEKRYRDRMRTWFKHESRAYFQLQNLQGQCIPEFYGTTTFVADSLNKIPSGILTEVPGILTQFIDGIMLEKLTSNSPTAITYPTSEKLLSSVPDSKHFTACCMEISDYQILSFVRMGEYSYLTLPSQAFVKVVSQTKNGMQKSFEWRKNCS